MIEYFTCIHYDILFLFIMIFFFQVRLPDVEFFINLGDWPLEKRSISEKPVPIFSWCGSDDTKDIVMPTYDMTESTLETMGRYIHLCRPTLLRKAKRQ